MMLTRIAYPAPLLLSLDEAKLHLRIDHEGHDLILPGLIEAAQTSIEQDTGRAILPQTWELRLPAFEPRIELPWPRIRLTAGAITSLSYVDAGGTTRTLSAGTGYQVEEGEPALLLPPYDGAWPDTKGVPNAVTIRYECGSWSTPPQVDESLKLAVIYRLMVAYQPDLRDTLESSIRALIGPYRIPRL